MRIIDLLLNEKYINLISNNPNKDKYKKEVYEMLSKAYVKIGGVKGTGFVDPDDMVKNIPFWKLYFKDGKLKFVIMYKDKEGRKMVALGTDGTTESKEELKKAIKQDLDRSYMEISNDLLRFIKKSQNEDLLKSLIIPVNKVKKLMKNDYIYHMSEIPKGNSEVNKISKDDPFYHHYYGRKINNEIHVKLMIGNSGKTIN